MNNHREFCGLPIKAWVTLFVIVFVIRAPFLFYFGLSVDAYSNMDRLPGYQFLAGQGRPGSYLLVELLNGLGLYGPIPQYANILLALPLLCISAVLLWSTIFSTRRGQGLAVISAAVLFLAHPYNAEILTFRDAAPFYALSTLLGVGGYYLGAVRGRFIVAILLVALALSIYQTFINFLAIAWLLTFLVSRIDIRRLRNVLRDDLRKVEIKGILLIVASLLTYLAAIKLINLITHTHQDGRATLIAFDEVPQRYHETLMVVRQFFAGDLIAKAGVTSAVTVLLWIAGFGICLADGSRRVKFVVVPLVFLLSCLAGIGVILVGRDFGPVPRVLVGFALLPAFGAVCALFYLRERGRAIMYGVLSVLLLSYAGISATVAADQVRVNRRDGLIAAVIEARMPLAPGQHIAIIRGPETWHGLSTQRDYMNMSAYWPDWSKVSALSEFYGYPIQKADPAEHARAVAYCRGAPVWPALDSTRVLDGGLAVVCMGRPLD
jgi:hypothetical protein